MPAKSPRITFTPTPATYELLKRFSAATGQSISGCTREMLETLDEHLLMLVGVLEKVRSLNNGAREAAESAAADAEAILGPLLEQAESVMCRLVQVIDEPTLPLDPEPPSSNTGVTISPQRDAV